MKKAIGLKFNEFEFAAENQVEPKNITERIIQSVLDATGFGEHTKLVYSGKYRVEGLMNLSEPKIGTLLSEEKVDKLISDMASGGDEVSVHIQY